ncbi:hypothetical protein P691DRAFT_337963 [Macrolepiota fuliginosa MF-IS2]|uniref:ferric-chelate reductase (NADPH) n=1 Tax=Macrolepiota fuliginosa MF-IS2 TaxID=1400762 RepID=A0A9P5XIP3_9AGAR|nr:hypothetical protein P691DRAFT_337963 [Macrolepiota fuliginosa MF-IS2]
MNKSLPVSIFSLQDTLRPAMSTLIKRASTSTAADRLVRDQKQRVAVIHLWIFLGCVLGLFTLINLLTYLLPRVWKRSSVAPLQRETSVDKEKPDSRPTYSFWSRFLAALAATYRIFAFRLLLPVGFGTHMLFSEMTFICAYMAALLMWLLIDTRDLTVMMYEDRAAHLATSQLPLIVALAGKNNIIAFLTGVSHEKLNVLHRAASRAVLVLLWIHGLTRLVSGLPEQFDFTHDWVLSGALGLGALTLAAILSLRPIRTAAFELFLVSHIVLILVFLIAGYYHAREQGMGDYIWPALMIWALDRFLRGLRIIWNNRLWAVGDSRYSLATIELVSNDTIRLTLARRFKWKAGQHAYITLPAVSRLPFEAHPFTIASIPDDPRAPGARGSGDNDIVFLIRGRSGMTARLRRLAARDDRTTITIPALVDGPYGCPPDLLKFTTNILIAGGSGISYTLPLLLNLIRAQHGIENSRSHGIKSEVRRVVFIWMIRDPEHLDWIYKTLSEALEASPSTLSVEPRIYVTGSKMPMVPVLPITSAAHPGTAASTSRTSSRCDSSPNSSVGEKFEVVEIEEKPELPSYSSLKLIHGRPSVRKLLHDEISASLGPVSVDGAYDFPEDEWVATSPALWCSVFLGFLR